jgi:hypothetical protein|tara:strand:- start:2594 stop:3424 length:831 start_codon:yes stop_codon:yes gene_type:complete
MEKKMKTRNFMNKIAINVFGVMGIILATMAPSLAADENEVFIDQTGDNLILTILQAGNSNKVSGDASQGSDLVISGSNLIIDIIQDGNGNEIFGAWTGNGSGSTVWDFYFYGDNNDLDANIGQTASANSVDMLWNIQGDTNVFDMDLGGNYSADNLNMDLTILGSRNNFKDSFTNTRTWGGTAGTNWNSTVNTAMSGIKVDSTSATWEMNITGDDNAIATNQTGNANHYLKFVLVGSDGDFQFEQSMAATCSPVCPGKIDVDIDSENASVSIRQKD